MGGGDDVVAVRSFHGSFSQTTLNKVYMYNGVTHEACWPASGRPVLSFCFVQTIVNIPRTRPFNENWQQQQIDTQIKKIPLLNLGGSLGVGNFVSFSSFNNTTRSILKKWKSQVCSVWKTKLCLSLVGAGALGTWLARGLSSTEQRSTSPPGKDRQAPSSIPLALRWEENLWPTSCSSGCWKCCKRAKCSGARTMHSPCSWP